MLKWEGPFLSGARPKPHLSFQEQRELLAARGLDCGDAAECEWFLSVANYYRLSGYARYFQVDPTNGRDAFREGSTLREVRSIYEADEALRRVCFDGLQSVELALRTAFAHAFSERIGSEGMLTCGETFTTAGSSAKPVEDCVLDDLDRTREPYIDHYSPRDSSTGRRRYERLPVWTAVEALTFGTLSKCIEYTVDKEVPRAVADQMGVAWKGFTSQVKAFAYLRNRVAHYSRLWNHSVLDAPAVPNNVLNRAKRTYGQTSHRSVFTVLVALDNALEKSGIRTDFLDTVVGEPSMSKDFLAGIMAPVAPPRRELGVQTIPNPSGGPSPQ